MERRQLYQQQQNKDTFSRPSVLKAQYIFGSQKCPSSGKVCNYVVGKCSRAFGLIVSCSLHLAEINILQAYSTEKVFIYPNNYPEGNSCFNFRIFDIHHHQDFSSAQPIKVRCDSRLAVQATNLFGFALLLTNELASVSSDGQRQFDLV